MGCIANFSRKAFAASPCQDDEFSFRMPSPTLSNAVQKSVRCLAAALIAFGSPWTRSDARSVSPSCFSPGVAPSSEAILSPAFSTTSA